MRVCYAALVVFGVSPSAMRFDFMAGIFADATDMKQKDAAANPPVPPAEPAMDGGEKPTAPAMDGEKPTEPTAPGMGG